MAHIRKAMLGIPLITNAGLCSMWLASRCQSRHQRQRGTQSWLCVSRQRRTQSVTPTLWIDWWEASFGNAGFFGEKMWAWVYGLLNVCYTDSTDGAVGLTVGHLVLVEHLKSLKNGKNCCSNSQLFYGCIHILITFILCFPPWQDIIYAHMYSTRGRASYSSCTEANLDYLVLQFR